MFIIVLLLCSYSVAGIAIRNEKEGSYFGVTNSGKVISTNALVSRVNDDVEGSEEKSTLWFNKVDGTTKAALSDKGFEYKSVTEELVNGPLPGNLGHLFIKKISDNTEVTQYYYNPNNGEMYTPMGLKIPDFTKLQPNYVKTIGYRLPRKGGRYSTIGFADGFGDVVQSQSQYDDFQYVVSGVYFNDKHQKEKIVAPFLTGEFGSFIKMSDGALIDSAQKFLELKNSLNSNFAYDEGDNNPFVEVKYDNSPDAKAIETSSPGSEFEMGGEHTTKVWQWGIPSLEHYFKHGEDIPAGLSAPEYYLSKSIDLSSFNSNESKEITFPWGKLVYSLLIPGENGAFDIKVYIGDDLKDRFLEPRSEIGYEYADCGKHIPSHSNAKYLLTVTKNPNGNFSQVVTDSRGNTHLSWSFDGENEVITTYEYDEEGKIVKETTPLGNDKSVGKTCEVIYTYDHKDRLKTKQTIDGGTITYYYDFADRITHTEDENVTVYNRYDRLGRVDSVALNLKLNGSTVTSCNLTSRYYYDRISTLDKDINNIFESAADAKTIYDEIVTKLENTRGRLFASVVYNHSSDVVTPGISNNVESIPLVTLLSYDKEGRVKCTYSYNSTIGWEMAVSEHDLNGSLLVSKFYSNLQSLNDKPTTIMKYNYNHRGHIESIVDGKTGNTYIRYVYDETGVLRETKYYSLSNQLLETVRFDCNVHGWTTKIQAGDRFQQNLYYFGVGAIANVAENFNGSISSSQYMYNTGRNMFTYQKDFSYDKNNSLVAVNTKSIDNFPKEYIDSLTETFSYDINGRILKKSRSEIGEVYNYDYGEAESSTIGHRLLGVDGLHIGFEKGNVFSKPVYEYDALGNMIIDRSKNMRVFYNYQNLPVRFEFYKDFEEPSESLVSWVDMVYDNTGNRISKTEYIDVVENGNRVTEKSGTIYSGLYVYSGKTLNLDEKISYSLSYANFPGGRDEFENSKRDNRYIYLTDHLGSTRMTLDNNGTVVEADMYTAYGEEIELENESDLSTKEKFTGKEFDEDGAVEDITDGIRLNYFGWRYYDPQIGLWSTLDPKEQFISGYSYGLNPLNGVDPDGLENTLYVLNADEKYEVTEQFLGDLQKRFSQSGLNINTVKHVTVKIDFLGIDRTDFTPEMIEKFDPILDETDGIIVLIPASKMRKFVDLKGMDNRYIFTVADQAGNRLGVSTVFSQWGFAYTDRITNTLKFKRTIMHESGHGIYGFEHYDDVRNLMSTSSPRKVHWKDLRLNKRCKEILQKGLWKEWKLLYKKDPLNIYRKGHDGNLRRKKEYK